MRTDPSLAQRLAFVALVAIAVLHARALYAPSDDAYIFFVYVRSWLEGLGLTFNGARVEGFRSPLWTAFLLLASTSGIDIPRLAEFGSTLFGVAALAATWALGRATSLSPGRALLAVALLAGCGDFAFYLGNGLETPLYTALLTGCAALALGSDARAVLARPLFPLALAALVLARPDGALFAGLLLCLLWARGGALGPVLRCGVIQVAWLAPVFVARRLYYGFWLPNTWYAKGNAGLDNLASGIDYLARAAPRYAPLVVLVGVAAAVALRTRPEQARRVAPLVVLPVVGLVAVAVIGGDNLVGARALVPLLPLICVLAVWASSRLPVGVQVAAVALVALLLGAAYQGDEQVQRHAERWRRNHDIRKAAGLHLREHFPADTLVALNPAGIIPYYSRLPTLDMLGLNDVFIAHEGKRDRTQAYAHQAGDGAYVLSRQPGVILFGGVPRMEPDERLSSREIWADPGFHRDYALEEWPGIGHAYVRNEGERAASATATASSPGSALRAGHTNVVLIVIDTLRADHLGAWGYAGGTSPQLDALAARGLRFSRFFSNAPWTRPGVASLLTGQYPRTTGIYEERFDILPADLVTLAERLSERGYRTLGLTSNPNINASFGFDQGFDRYGDTKQSWRWMEGDGKPKALDADRPVLDDAATMTDRSLALVDAHRSEFAARPFYLQVLYLDPHRPHEAPSEHEAAVAAGPHRGYDAEIHYVDAEVGRLLEGLRKRGLLDDSLIVVTSDHGEGLDDQAGVPLSRNHGDHLYDSSLHIPLILAHPSLVPRVEARLGASVDLVPTLMDLLGWPIGPGEIAGHSLLSGDADRPVISETDWRGANRLSVRTGAHRFVRADDARRYQEAGVYEGTKLRPVRRSFLELPTEELHALGKPENPRSGNLRDRDPERAAALARLLEEWEQRTPARAPTGRSPDDRLTLGDGRTIPDPSALGGTDTEVDDALRTQLEALGYLLGE